MKKITVTALTSAIGITMMVSNASAMQVINYQCNTDTPLNIAKAGNGAQCHALFSYNRSSKVRLEQVVYNVAAGNSQMAITLL